MAKLHIWHRYIGVTASLFVIVLSATGLFLNFSDTLKLNKSHISTAWLLNHYNIGEFSVTSFQTNGHLVSQASNYIYLNGHYALNLKQSLVGALYLDDFILLATQSSLVLIDHDGQIVDEIGKYTGLPENPLGISITSNGHPVIRGVNTYWKGSKELSAWQPLKGPHPKWVAPTHTPNDIDKLIQEHARSNEINYERVLLDLHSGRLLGGWGQNIMSIAAILLLILAFTGIIIWLRKKPNQ
ncbi:MAG: PepSY domain-containing protein [Gammaproteobacteria bacterium]|nr:PepSY domain-containing protein [Gammaproteobacteria bacterium]